MYRYRYQNLNFNFLYLGIIYRIDDVGNLDFVTTTNGVGIYIRLCGIYSMMIIYAARESTAAAA